ncbi:hypothetical protein POJ06DRAFT_263472 [Lipomyces tetrasporus]|uniref:Inner membrane assembly complex subunit 17 n=1 Tax=Lipomyces tetrasporus TaxID=54092 RepID=A0AAD7QKB5_9ASCO|nr:uncharacterized protein POJ06DRAFT_263472 [Lipomyces tetrasporus]KAJ8096811.1 hypothetical protein POJ06DRAFT_263472 [Lipomyces tetrasporus]
MILRQFIRRPSTRQLPSRLRLSRCESSTPSTPKPFGSSQLWPVAKVFLYGSLVYMLLHWAWWKLETDELYDRLSGRAKELEVELTRTIEERNRGLVGQSNQASSEENRPSWKSMLRKLWQWK